MDFPSPPEILTERDVRSDQLTANPNEVLLRTYAWMYLARITDNRILELFRQGLIKGTVTGGQGNEGLIVPLALLADKSNDVVSFTHRDLGGHLIWSDHLCVHLNQYFANAQSPTLAREGNIHHGDPANRSLPMISHLGAMISTVLGSADSQRRLGRAAVGYAFFGDGGSSTGDVHESMNLASLLSLPVLFVIENNRYAYSTPTEEQFASGTELWKRAAGYGIESKRIDCTDATGALPALAEAIERVRSTGKPFLVEAEVLRLRGHAAYDTGDYLRPGESEGFWARDPLPKIRSHLNVGEDKVVALEKELEGFLEECVAYCLKVPRPDPATLENSVFRGRSSRVSLDPFHFLASRGHGGRKSESCAGHQSCAPKSPTRATRGSRDGPGHRHVWRCLQGDRGPPQGLWS